MLLEPTLRRVGAVAIAALMLGTAPAALFAETPADTLVIAAASTTSYRWTRMRPMNFLASMW